MLPLVFQEVPSRVVEVLNVARQQAPITQVVEFDENGNVLTREVERSRGLSTPCESFHHGEWMFFWEDASVRRSFIERELSTSDVGIVAVNKKSLVSSMPPTALSVMAGWKEKHVVADNTIKSSVELSYSARKSYEQLYIAMEFV